MAWFRVDDGFHDHDKARLAGFLGRALWFYAGTKCAQAKTDGVIAAHRLDEYCYLSGVRAKKESGRTAVQLLVASGLWHDHETIQQCTRCKSRTGGGLDEGAHYFHDWTDYQPTSDDLASPETKKIAQRRKALFRNDHLRDAIYTRDHGRCRYCGTTCDPNPNNRRGRDGLTYDHLDPGCFAPDGGNFLEGVVVACRGCNSAKKDRTVAQWVADGGRPLRPVPTDELDPPTLDELGPGSDPADPDLTGSDPAEESRVDGSGRDGSGSDRTRVGAGAPQGPEPQPREHSGSRTGTSATEKDRPP